MFVILFEYQARELCFILNRIDDLAMHLVLSIICWNYTLTKSSMYTQCCLTATFAFSFLLFSYQELMTESSRMPLFDLRKLNASLPVSRLEDPAFKVLVVGAKDDFIVVSSWIILESIC